MTWEKRRGSFPNVLHTLLGDGLDVEFRKELRKLSQVNNHLTLR